MFTTVRVDGEYADPIEDDEGTVTVEFDERIVCKHCGNDIAEYTHGWESEEDGEVECQENDSRHEPAPRVPANGAGIRFTENSVQVWVSVGDPRGAFLMEVRQLTDGRVVIHHPYPDEPLPHAQTRELHPGTLVLTSTEPQPQEA